MKEAIMTVRSHNPASAGLPDSGPLRQEVIQQMMMARTRIYQLFQQTPLEELESPLPVRVFLKREDLSPIHSYKWRGAYNAMAQLPEEAKVRGVVAASAGNHAQGVAASARRLGIIARVYMPGCAPMTKRRAVEALGGDLVEIRIVGDTYDDAASASKKDAAESGRLLVHPYDDVRVVGGQGTLADEIVTQSPGVRYDVAFLQIGGGGMAAASALWLKTVYPDIRIVGVECEGQASMGAALEAGEPVSLSTVDSFCDGTCVKRAGDIGFTLLNELLDEHLVVTREDVCHAIGYLWETKRLLPEPAGALGFAGLLRRAETEKGNKALAVITGANLDLSNLALIANQASGAGSAESQPDTEAAKGDASSQSDGEDWSAAAAC